MCTSDHDASLVVWKVASYQLGQSSALLHSMLQTERKGFYTLSVLYVQPAATHQKLSFSIGLVCAATYSPGITNSCVHQQEIEAAVPDATKKDIYKASEVIMACLQQQDGVSSDLLPSPQPCCPYGMPAVLSAVGSDIMSYSSFNLL